MSGEILGFLASLQGILGTADEPPFVVVEAPPEAQELEKLPGLTYRQRRVLALLDPPVLVLGDLLCLDCNSEPLREIPNLVLLQRSFLEQTTVI